MGFPLEEVLLGGPGLSHRGLSALVSGRSRGCLLMLRVELLFGLGNMAWKTWIPLMLVSSFGGLGSPHSLKGRFLPKM